MSCVVSYHGHSWRKDVSAGTVVVSIVRLNGAITIRTNGGRYRSHGILVILASVCRIQHVVILVMCMIIHNESIQRILAVVIIVKATMNVQFGIVVLIGIRIRRRAESIHNIVTVAVDVAIAVMMAICFVTDLPGESQGVQHIHSFLGHAGFLALQLEATLMALCVDPSTQFGILGAVRWDFACPMNGLIVLQLIPVLRPLVGVYGKVEPHVFQLPHPFYYQMTWVCVLDHVCMGRPLSMHPFGKAGILRVAMRNQTIYIIKTKNKYEMKTKKNS